MAKGRRGSNLIGGVGAVLIGAAILLFVCIQILTALKDAGASSADTATINSTVDSLIAFLTVTTILLGILGITMVGSAIIAYISGAFGA